MERPAPATPRRPRRRDRGPGDGGLPASLAERQLRHAKDEPADFDACWDTDGVDLDALDPVLLDLSKGRVAQKARFGGELFPNIAEAASGLVFADFFQVDRDTGRKGIVVLSIGDAP